MISSHKSTKSNMYKASLALLAALLAFGLVILVFKINGKRTPSPETQWQAITELVRQGKIDQARLDLAEWLKDIEEGKANPPTTEMREQAVYLAAELALRQNDAPAAIAGYESLLTNQRAMNPRRRLASLYVIEGRRASARDILWQLYNLAHDPADLMAITTQAFMPPSLEFQSTLEKYLEQSPRDPWLRRASGLLNFNLGQLAEAKNDLAEVIPAFADDIDGKLALAETLLGLGNANVAETSLNEEPEAAQDHARWFLTKGKILASLKRMDESLASFRRAVELDPKNRLALFSLAQSLRTRGDANVAEAKDWLDRAEVRRKEADTLKATLTRMISVPINAKSAEELYRLCASEGLAREARAWLEQAVAIDPLNRENQAKLATLPALPLETIALPKLGPEPTTKSVATNTPTAPKSTLHFTDIAAHAGLNFHYSPHATKQLLLPDTMGGGVALLDYDRDGWLDVYFVGGCELPVDPQQVPHPNRLFHNRGNGTFEDVTTKAKVGGYGYGMGCAVGDMDNDGFDDLFVTGLGRVVLYRNKGDGTFEDVTERAGVQSTRWTTAAGFADLDGDRDLDLVVITYVQFDPKQPKLCNDPGKHPIHCSPNAFTAEIDHLFRNNGDGTFTDVARQAGFDTPNGPGLGLAIADFDHDRKLDIFVANDAQPNFLYHNEGGLKFREIAVASGVALDGSGKATASMGVVAEDLNDDGKIDIFHTNFNDEANTLLAGFGDGMFHDITSESGVGWPSVTNTGFGTTASDFNNDGNLDLFITNGHVDDQPWFNVPIAQKAELYQSRGKGRFLPAGAEAGPYFSQRFVGRGVASGDVDNDGLIDLVVVHRDQPVALLKGTSPSPGRWISLTMVGTKSAKTPIGTRVVAHTSASNRPQTRTLTSGTSYLSQNDMRLHFGFGEAFATTKVHLRLHWPSGGVEDFRDLSVDRHYILEEGKPPIAR